MDDLDGIVTGSNSGGGALDPLYERLMGQQFQEEDRAEQENTVPRGEYYFEVQSAKGSVNKWQDKTFVSGRFGLKILEGEQAVGRVAFVDLDLTVPTNIYDEAAGAFRPATPDEYAKNEAAFGKLMTKVKRVFGLQTLLPPQQTVDSITSWLKASVGKKGVGGIYIKTTKNGDRNMFWWKNLAAPDDQLFKDKAKTKPKGTALECLRAAVAKKAAKGGNGAASPKVSAGGLD